MSVCDNCKQRPGEFICIQKECVKLQGNSTLCYQCFFQLHQSHEPKKFEDICPLAKGNCKKHIEIFESIIISSTKEINDLEKFLEIQKELYLQWHNIQKKSIKEFMEKLNFNLTIRIQEVQQVLQSQNLDSILNYLLINVNEQEVQYQKEYEQSNFVRKIQINEIAARVNSIKDLKFSLSDLSNIFVTMPLPSIPKAQEEQTVKFQICNVHKISQQYLCIHNDCISQKSTFPFYCKNCFLNDHKQHNYKTYAKKYKLIKQEQDEKTKLITQEQEKIKSCMQQEFIKNCELIQKQLSEKIKKYDQVKSNMLKIKEQSLEHLNKLINFKFIQNNINVNLLSKKIEDIKLEYSIKYKCFCGKMSIDLESESRNIFAFTAQLDQKYENEQNEISLFRQQIKSNKEKIDQLKNELNLKDEEIDKLKNELKSKNQEIDNLKNDHKSKDEKINQLENELKLNSKINLSQQIIFSKICEQQKALQILMNELTKIMKEKNNYQFCREKDFFYSKTFENGFIDIKAQINAVYDNIQKTINQLQQIPNSQTNQKLNSCPPTINQQFYIEKINQQQVFDFSGRLQGQAAEQQQHQNYQAPPQIQIKQRNQSPLRYQNPFQKQANGR